MDWVGVRVICEHFNVDTKVEREVEFSQSTQLLYSNSFGCLSVALFVAVKDFGVATSHFKLIYSNGNKKVHSPLILWFYYVFIYQALNNHLL